MDTEYFIFLGKLIVNFFFLVFFFRIVSRKELREITPLDIGYTVLVVNIAWDLTLEKDYSLLESFLAMLLLSLIIQGLNMLTYKNEKVNVLLSGKPEIIVYDGNVNEELMNKEKITRTELNALLRQQGVFNIDDIEVAVLEIDGGVSVLKRGGNS